MQSDTCVSFLFSFSLSNSSFNKMIERYSLCFSPDCWGVFSYLYINSSNALRRRIILLSACFTDAITIPIKP